MNITIEESDIAQQWKLKCVKFETFQPDSHESMISRLTTMIEIRLSDNPCLDTSFIASLRPFRDWFAHTDAVGRKYLQYDAVSFLLFYSWSFEHQKTRFFDLGRIWYNWRQQNASSGRKTGIFLCRRINHHNYYNLIKRSGTLGKFSLSSPGPRGSPPQQKIERLLDLFDVHIYKQENSFTEQKYSL